MKMSEHGLKRLEKAASLAAEVKQWLDDAVVCAENGAPERAKDYATNHAASGIEKMKGEIEAAFKS